MMSEPPPIPRKWSPRDSTDKDDPLIDHSTVISITILVILGILCVGVVLIIVYFCCERRRRHEQRRRGIMSRLGIDQDSVIPPPRHEVCHTCLHRRSVSPGVREVGHIQGRNLSSSHGTFNPIFVDETRHPIQHHSSEENINRREGEAFGTFTNSSLRSSARQGNLERELPLSASVNDLRSGSGRRSDIDHETRVQNSGIEMSSIENRHNSKRFGKETPDNDSIADSELFGGTKTPNAFMPVLKELSVVNERSVTLTVADKLVVFISRMVGSGGDVLYLDNMGISLQVPPGAVKPGENKLIILLLNWDLGDNPFMENRHALVSPVVFVGPHGLKLEKPCILTYKHCSFDARHVKVMKSETDLIGKKNWDVMCQPEDTSGACVITPDECQLRIDTFTLYTSLQQPPDGQTGRKWVQIAVFCRPLQRHICHQQVRIYFLNKTYCALQWSIYNESRFGGRLICPEKLFLLNGTEKDIVLSLTYLCDGWQIIDGKVERIPYFQVWHGKCPHISMCLKKQHQNVKEMNFSMEIYQEERENDLERLVVQALEDQNSSDHVISGEPICSKHSVTIQCNSDLPKSIKVEQNFPGHMQNNSLQVEILGPNKSSNELTCMEAAAGRRLIPENVRMRLKMMLDVQNTVAMGWKNLAEKLGYDTCIPYLESKFPCESPTEALLQAAESRNIPILQLMDMLSDIGRHDAAEVLQECVETRQIREPVENDLSDEDNGCDNNTSHFNNLY